MNTIKWIKVQGEELHLGFAGAHEEALGFVKSQAANAMWFEGVRVESKFLFNKWETILIFPKDRTIHLS